MFYDYINYLLWRRKMPIQARELWEDKNKGSHRVYVLYTLCHMINPHFTLLDAWKLDHDTLWKNDKKDFLLSTIISVGQRLTKQKSGWGWGAKEAPILSFEKDKPLDLENYYQEITTSKSINKLNIVKSDGKTEVHHLNTHTDTKDVVEEMVQGQLVHLSNDKLLSTSDLANEVDYTLPILRIQEKLLSQEYKYSRRAIFSLTGRTMETASTVMARTKDTVSGFLGRKKVTEKINMTRGAALLLDATEKLLADAKQTGATTIGGDAFKEFCGIARPILESRKDKKGGGMWFLGRRDQSTINLYNDVENVLKQYAEYQQAGTAKIAKPWGSDPD